jgi:serine/threonine-protein kinase
MRASLLAVVALVAVAARPAFAQSAGHDAIALALFADGRELAAHGDYARACDKFEAANQLTHWLGVELNLADCYEHTGRTASAWSMFRKAADHAARDHDARVAYARARASALVTRLSHVVLVRAPGSVPMMAIGPNANVVVSVDGVEVPGAGFDVALPIDPGAHVIEIQAPGHVKRTLQFAVTAHADVQVAVPELEPIAPASVHATMPGRVSARTRSHRHLALWIGGAGVALAGTSLALGIDAKLGYDAAVRDHCDAQLRCDDRGMSAIRGARLRGDVATVAGGVGLVAIAAGIVLYVASPDERAHALDVVPVASPTTIGVAVEGRL